MQHKNGMTGSEKLDSLKDTVKGLVDQGAQTVDAIKHRAADIKDQAVEGGGAALDRMTDLIKAHPLKSIAIAFGVGFLAMRLLRR